MLNGKKSFIYFQVYLTPLCNNILFKSRQTMRTRDSFLQIKTNLKINKNAVEFLMGTLCSNFIRSYYDETMYANKKTR